MEPESEPHFNSPCATRKFILPYPFPICRLQSQSSKDAVFTGLIFVYYEGELSEQQLAELLKLYEEKNLKATFRGQPYVAYRRTLGRKDSCS
jgi:hypothetical protein